jgi:hypothetical protein
MCFLLTKLNYKSTTGMTNDEKGTEHAMTENDDKRREHGNRERKNDNDTPERAGTTNQGLGLGSIDTTRSKT